MWPNTPLTPDRFSVMNYSRFLKNGRCLYEKLCRKKTELKRKIRMLFPYMFTPVFLLKEYKFQIFILIPIRTNFEFS